ncbi:SDR family oxidoreductase [Rhabdobacter roseus]|uniref:NAD(P)-dependent dehydrogenase (Short-subunit alcohol dehydrogenase family) n=1 Tax=Rhabdobacter roseus TaxID=1655419 RepID=A0A840TSH3_9BACT|nr:SDR family NAD(P)-dependent oxidoreductase [Rhabdobacter roseus]MBB5286901.1 NAD(P)-dependent dehydrogenase (short-subunit alcohol dehydrogenase family) [Rhabdobacter roseus]
MNQPAIHESTSLRKTLGWTLVGLGALAVANAIRKQMNKYPLEGKVVFITGGSRGLGLVMARQLAAKGARLAICARTAEQVERARQDLQQRGAEVLAFTLDVTQRDEVHRRVQEVITHYGQLDVLINNAGVMIVGPQEAMNMEDFDWAMNTHFWAPLHSMQAVIPHFRERGEGRIVNIASIGGKIAFPHLLPYTASKFALVGLSEGMHAELKKYNIHVTTVSPNLTRTGSPRNVTVKGDAEAEYAWFKISDSAPWLAQEVESAAADILEALEYGKSEVVLTATGKAAALLQGVMPGWVSDALVLVDRFLPENIEGGSMGRKGHDSESARSQGPIAALTDKAAMENNEL